MSEKEKEIIRKLIIAIKTMSEFDKGYLLGMGEALISPQREKHEEQTA